MDGHEGLDRPRLVGALDAYSASVILVFCQRPEDKMNRIPNELNESNVRQICSVLESLAKRPDISKEEIEALEAAAIALMAVNMGKATQRAYGVSGHHNQYGFSRRGLDSRCNFCLWQLRHQQRIPF